MNVWIRPVKVLRMSDGGDASAAINGPFADIQYCFNRVVQ